MKKIRIGICIISILAILLSAMTEPAFAANAPTLVGVKSFSVLAGSIVTNTGATTMPGNLGVSPGIGSPLVTGFPPGTVGPPGTIYAADGVAAAAQADDTAAFTFLDQTPCTPGYTFGLGTIDLAGKSLGPGIYCADAFTLNGGGTLALTGNGVWIFKSASSLITSTNSKVVGDDPCNVWWRVVSSATIEVGTTFIGNILALTSISLKTGASLNGRALAQTGEVSMDANVITSECGPGTGANNGIFGPGGTFTVVPEYPWGVFLLLVLMLPVYMLLKRGNQNSILKRRSQ